MALAPQQSYLKVPELQKQHYLPKYASGEIIGSFCLTEPDVGSDAASVKTAAIRDGDSYVINGTKRFLTNAPRAATFTVMARADPQDKGAKCVSAFVVDANSQGISIGPKDKKMGQAGFYTSVVIFEDVRVPAENLIGGREGMVFITAIKVVDRGRLQISAVCIGVAERLIQDALAYAIERR